ncbi:MAG: DNA mismatch repair endonuclease MutL [Nitrospirae bacterium]|nr:DNA mismatch repair endonuclease MutL [Nitrospirota bacterium]
MPKIALLPDSLINKIAAGEVIERPASVVRELLDNSIDAGAAKIDVEVLHGGKKLIKVSDNGCGMDREDVSLCFQRHATSKISSEDDLFNISTLGFRGEALSSIASVSKVTLTTAPEGAGVGTKLEIGARGEIDIADAPPLKGTAIEIRDIFYNTPARRKFLKSTPTELSHIIEAVIQKAFAYPGISFSLSHNGSEILNVPSAHSLKERFGQLYGEELAEEFIEINKEGSGIKVYGFASGENFTRASRSHQTIFVNRRPVKNLTVNHALYNAYSHSIPSGRHPAYFIFLDIDTKKVDVNVHPAKREVRFEKPDEIHKIVGAAIYEALNPESSSDVVYTSSHKASEELKGQAFSYGRDSAGFRESLAGLVRESQTDFFASGITSDVPAYFHIGESFIAHGTNDGLLIIDQHAAHERILYEKFLNKASVEAESLFLPLRVELPVKEFGIITKHKGFLKELGLEVEDFGGNNVIVKSMPKELKKADIKSLLLDIASNILEEETSGIKGDIDKASMLDKIAARLACHTSVRGSEPLGNEEIARMMDDLQKCKEPGKCPHGRPTKIYLSLDDLQKMFKRK